MQSVERKVELFEAAMDDLRRIKVAAKEHMFNAIGLTEPQVHILLALHGANDCRTTDMARALSVSASAATQTVDTLVKRGYVHRVDDPADRRVNRLELTPTGQAEAETILQRRRVYYMKFLSQMTDAELDQILQTFHRLARSMTINEQPIAERTK